MPRFPCHRTPLNILVVLLLLFTREAAVKAHSLTSSCTPDVFAYHAPARTVPVPQVDPNLQRDFLLLFQVNPVKNDTTIQPSIMMIDPDILAMINDLCPKEAFFYSFAPRHFEAITMLLGQFMAQPTAADVLQLAQNEYVREEINKRVWYYALVGAFVMRPDLNGYFPAWQLDAIPDLYLTAAVLKEAVAGSSHPLKISDETSDTCVSSATVLPTINTEETVDSSTPSTIDDNCVVYRGTNGSTNAAENNLWYFREDVMVNQHHWYWHQYFPLSAVRFPDRRGEVFYYTHHNIIARYNAERLSNGLDVETAIDLQLGDNIGVGFDSDMIDKQSGIFWNSREANTLLKDTNHATDPDFELTVGINELAAIYQNLLAHVSDGYLLATKPAEEEGGSPTEFQLDIKNEEGLHHLGNTFEASDESTHPDVYHAFGVHNLAHIVVALASDPDYTCKRPPGVTADLTVTMRDPAFYRIHTLVDDFFDHYKQTLTPYHLNEGDWPLVWEGVQIQSVQLFSMPPPPTSPDVDIEVVSNFVNTFWSTQRFPLEQGIDGSIHNGDVDTEICHQHLNHEEFQFKLTVNVANCLESVSSQGTVRIFMAPRFNANDQRFAMNDTRKLMFQLDAFPVELRPGTNIITRNSKDSSSTKPWSRSLQQMIQDPANGGQAEYCGCGWPEHLYLPKGTAQGMEFDLFAMITNYDQDQVQDTLEDLNIPEPCNSPYLFCGIPYRKYPDARPMGYPFDRLPYSVMDGENGLRQIDTLEEYQAHVPNMMSTVVTIQHVDEFRD